MHNLFPIAPEGLVGKQVNRRPQEKLGPTLPIHIVPDQSTHVLSEIIF